MGKRSVYAEAKYSAEFKQGAVEQTRQPGVNLPHP